MDEARGEYRSRRHRIRFIIKFHWFSTFRASEASFHSNNVAASTTAPLIGSVGYLFEFVRELLCSGHAGEGKNKKSLAGHKPILRFDNPVVKRLLLAFCAFDIKRVCKEGTFTFSRI